MLSCLCLTNFPVCLFWITLLSFLLVCINDYLISGPLLCFSDLFIHLTPTLKCFFFHDVSLLLQHYSYIHGLIFWANLSNYLSKSLLNWIWCRVGVGTVREMENGKEPVLLFQVIFPAVTWWLTAVHNSRSKESDDLFWSLRAWHPCGTQTHMQEEYPPVKCKNKINKSQNTYRSML